MKSNAHIDQRTWNLVKKIASNIKKIRKSKGLTQADMSGLGFSSRWYQRLESGQHIPTIPTLDKLAAAFKTDITEFFK